MRQSQGRDGDEDREDEEGAGDMVTLRYLAPWGASLGSGWPSPGLSHGGFHRAAAKGRRDGCRCVYLPPPVLPLL